MVNAMKATIKSMCYTTVILQHDDRVVFLFFFVYVFRLKLACAAKPQGTSGDYNFSCWAPPAGGIIPARKRQLA